MSIEIVEVGSGLEVVELPNETEIIEIGIQGPPGPQGMAGDPAFQLSLQNADTVILRKGTPVYLFNTGQVKRASAASVVAARVLGLVADTNITEGSIGAVLMTREQTALVSEWEDIVDEVGGLLPGASYYLAVTPGKLSRVAPTAVGNFVVKLGYAVSTTTLIFDLSEIYEL